MKLEELNKLRQLYYDLTIFSDSTLLFNDRYNDLRISILKDFKIKYEETCKILMEKVKELGYNGSDLMISIIVDFNEFNYNTTKITFNLISSNSCCDAYEYNILNDSLNLVSCIARLKRDQYKKIVNRYSYLQYLINEKS